jgi:site-specific DNA-cytosine methylase
LGLLRFLEQHAVPLVQVENVAELLKPANWRVCKKELLQRGYGLLGTKLQANQHGFPQTRPRVYALAVRLADWGLSPQALAAVEVEMRRLLDSLTLPALPLERLVLPEGDLYLARHVESQLQKVPHAAARPGGSKWKGLHQRAATLEGLAISTFVAPPEQRSSSWYPLLTPREQRVLGHACVTNRNLFSVDIQQSLGRAFHQAGPSRSVSTICPNSKIWSMSLRRLLTGFDHMMLQGFPRAVIGAVLERLPPVDDNLLKDLAGNAFSANSFLAFLVAALCALPTPPLPGPPQRKRSASIPADALRLDEIDEMLGR